jgi:hypothetical protein
LRSYPVDNPPSNTNDPTAEVQRYIVEEVNRRVEERVKTEMAASRVAQAQAQDDFLSRSQQEQNWATFLMSFGGQHEQGSGELGNLLTLVKAASVSFFLTCFPSSPYRA